MKETYNKLFEHDFESAKAVLNGMQGRRKLGDMIDKASGSSARFVDMSWDELDKQGLLAELKEKAPDLYQAKYDEMAKTLNIMQR